MHATFCTLVSAMVREGHPLKQGLKRREWQVFQANIVEVREGHPLKQGLKL